MSELTQVHVGKEYRSRLTGRVGRCVAANSVLREVHVEMDLPEGITTAIYPWVQFEECWEFVEEVPDRG